MNIKKIVVGELQENCYIVEKNNICLIIDPGDEPNKIINNIDKKVVGILVTHNHFDHIGALQSLIDYYHIDINDHIEEFDYEIIDTKGHTMDSKTYYFPIEKIMFTGDFLFENSIGRTDLGGDNYLMIESLNKISEYPDDIVIYPGHGDSSTLGREKENFSYYIDLLK